MLPDDTVLGKLQIVDVFEYYDRPVLFTCKDEYANPYLVILDDEDSDGEAWLYSQMSFERYSKVKSGEVDLYHAFKDNEFDFVYEVRVYRDGRMTRMNTLACSVLPDSRLPAIGELAAPGGEG